jgi:hypothetical protein
MYSLRNTFGTIGGILKGGAKYVNNTMGSGQELIKKAGNTTTKTSLTVKLRSTITYPDQ